MRRSWRWLSSLGLAALIAAGLIWWQRDESLHPAVPSPVPTAAPAATAPVAAEATATPHEIAVDAQMILRMQASAGPPAHDSDSPREDVDALHARASAGDVIAMHTLGSRLHGCLSNWRDPDAREPYKLLQIELRGNVDRSRPHIERDRQSFDRYDRAMARHVECLALGRERAMTGLGWLERAGRTGDIDAKVAFAQQALGKDAYGDTDEMYADLDEIIRRRDLADAWIRDAIESGDRSALASIANGDDHLVRNPRTRALYATAWSLVLQRDFGGDNFTSNVQYNLQRETYLQSEQDWARDDAAWNGFEAEARRIAEHTEQLPPEYRRPRPPTGG